MFMCMHVWPQGVHVTALREMKLLRELHHPNVIALRDVFPLKKNIALVRCGIKRGNKHGNVVCLP